MASKCKEGDVTRTLAELAVDLATEDVEQVRGLSHAGNLHVAVLVLAVQLVSRGEYTGLLVAKLEPTLHTTGRVLGTLAVITVRQRDNQTGTLQPLGFTGSNELINDTLSVVGKVTELGFPHDKSLGGGQRVTVLEAKSTELAQGRVGDDEAALLVTDVLQGGVGGLGLLVVQDGVTLREGTTLNILTGDTDVVALLNEGTESKSLGGSPVNVLALVDGLLAVGKNTLQVAVEGEALGDVGTADLVGDVLEGLGVHGSVKVRKNFGGQLLGRLEVVPGGSQPLLAGRLVFLAAVEAVVEHAPDPLLVLINVLLGEGTLLDQLVDVFGKLILVLGNALVHQRLGERRLVSLVVTLLTVADNVNDNITLELSAPVSSDLANIVDSLSIVGVDVEHGGIDRLGNVRAVGGGTGKTGVGGETDLVVHDDVDSTTSGVGG